MFACPVGVGVVLDAGTKVWIVMRLDYGFRLSRRWLWMKGGRRREPRGGGLLRGVNHWWGSTGTLCGRG